jgi:hypothetical protein
MPRRDPSKSDEDIENNKKKHKVNLLKSARNLLETDKIEDFDHLFTIYKISNVAKDIHMGQGTIKKRIANPSSFSHQEISALAELYGVEDEKMDRFVKKQISSMKRKSP